MKDFRWIRFFSNFGNGLYFVLQKKSSLTSREFAKMYTIASLVIRLVWKSIPRDKMKFYFDFFALKNMSVNEYSEWYSLLGAFSFPFCILKGHKITPKKRWNISCLPLFHILECMQWRRRVPGVNILKELFDRILALLQFVRN